MQLGVRVCMCVRAVCEDGKDLNNASIGFVSGGSFRKERF